MQGPEDSESQSANRYQELKENIHRRLIDRLDLTRLDTIPKDELRRQVREVVENLIANDSEAMLALNRTELIEEILNEVFGFGPLEPLLNDPTISDILVNNSRQVYVERFGKLELSRTVFKDDVHLMNIIDRIVTQVGRRIDESVPMVDARLADGSRVNAIIPPLALDGPSLSIRKFGTQEISIRDLVNFETIPQEVADALAAVVKARLNVVIAGGTGSGKTTLLNVLTSFVPEQERIITIEDAAELQLQQDHVVRLETRPANTEGQGAISPRDLLKNALRMRPDRIIVGEVRGGEALDMLQAMNTGHDGSMTTLHANSTRDALRRLETMILMAGTNLPDKAMREQIGSAVNVLIHIARLSDGRRKVMKVSEITGMEGNVVSMHDIFVFEKFGVDESGRVLGAFKATGIVPKFVDHLTVAGIHLTPSLFDGYFKSESQEQDDE